MITPSNNEQVMLVQPGDAKRPGRWHYAILAGVMILAGALRLGGITQVGIRYDDEACYVTDARLWHRCASVMIDPQAIAALWNRDKKAFQQSLDEHGVDFTTRFHPKQGYTFLAALMMFVVGDRPAGVLAADAYQRTGDADPIEYYRTPLIGRLFAKRITDCLSLLPDGRRVLDVGYGSGVSF